MSDSGTSTPTVPAAGSAERRQRPWEKANRGPRALIGWGVAWILILAVVVFAVVTPSFLTWDNIKGVLDSAALTGIIAVSMAPMTLSGNFVSLGTQQMAVGGAMLFGVFLVHGMAPGLAIAIILALLVLVAVIQGSLVAVGLNPVITTLAAGAIIYGVTITASNSAPVSLPQGSVSWGSGSVAGVPVDVVVLLVVTILVSGFTRFTSLGRETVLTGANRATARLSGISFSRVTIFAFLLFGLGAGVVSVLYAAGFQSVDPNNSLSTLTFDAVGAMLVGGISIGGGQGAPWRAALGAVFIAMATDTLLLRNMTSGEVQFFEGIIITVAIIIRVLAERRKVTA